MSWSIGISGHFEDDNPAHAKARADALVVAVVENVKAFIGSLTEIPSSAQFHFQHTAGDMTDTRSVNLLSEPAE